MKKMLLSFPLLFAVLILISMIGCEKLSQKNEKADVLTQISTYDTLFAGLYDGVASLKTVEESGDLGLGTLHGFNGEVVLLDGKYHLINGDGHVVSIPDMNVTTPFLALAWFREEARQVIADGTTFALLKEKPETFLPSLNLIYAIKLEGKFRHVKTRSMHCQTKPYKPMSELIKTQPTFEFNEVEGTMIGFWTPSSMAGVGLLGWHLHFITKDHQGGGHVLEFTAEEANLKLDEKTKFHLQISNHDDYKKAVLGAKK